MECDAAYRQHILAELERIDLLIRLQVRRAREQHEADEFQGLYISEREVDEMLDRPAGLPAWAAAPVPFGHDKVQGAFERIAAGIARYRGECTAQGITLCLDELARLFSLTAFEVDVLLVGLAPEIDLRYERLYSYLQDDVTKKRPSVDLALNLLCPSFEAKLATRGCFTPGARLVRHQLLDLFDDPAQPHPPLLSRYFKIDERIVGYLFGSDEIDQRLRSYARRVVPERRMGDLILPADVKVRLTQLVREARSRPGGLILYFQGPYGVGKQSTAEALCHELGIGLLVVDGGCLAGMDGRDFERLVLLAVREARLAEAALYWSGFDALLSDDAKPRLDLLIRELAGTSQLSFLAGETAWEPSDVGEGMSFLRVEFPRPTAAERIELWSASLNGDTTLTTDVDLPALAGKFRFSGGQIRDAAATARNLARWRDCENHHITTADLYAACRLQSNRKLATLARKITPCATWDDIVLPPDRMEQLREIVNAVKYRTQVYDVWGFDRKLSLGKGLNVLFAGPSGTGKTMAAEIMAGELGLDLYKIDLSQVVSKYIGETEKNLNRVFGAAENANAILFFDEADALFGKRSEVRDAHDRYANIEISYLLQKMEEYDGVAILASNLSQNLDDAFVRRLAFTIHFPFPDEAQRQRIWAGIWPVEAPLSADLRLDLLAGQFRLSGGNIRNVALAACFLAAADGGRVALDHVLQATRREYQKLGRVPSEAEFSVVAGGSA